MSYNSKKTIVNMIAGILLMIAYLVYALGERAPESNDLKSWAIAMLIFIGISVAAAIVIQILFHIAVAIGIAVKECKKDDRQVERIVKSTMVEDERDKLIELKSARIGYMFAGIGFVAALVVLALGLSALTAMHTTFGTCAAAFLIGGGVNIFHYERGV